MLAELVVVHRINDHSAQPSGLSAVAFRHDLLGQFSKSISIFLGSSGRDLQRTLGFRRVRCQEDPAVGFNSQDAIASLQAKAIGHIFRQRGTDGSASLSEGHFFGHGAP